MTEQELINAPECVLGIDPGLSGAVVKLGRGCLECRRDFKGLSDIADAIQELSEGADTAAIEFVHSFPGQGSVSVFGFGRSVGVAFGALFCAGFGGAKPLEEVVPQVWQRYFRERCHLEKSALFDSRTLAEKIVPESAPFLQRVKDHGTGDALLIAAYRLLQGPLLKSRCLTPRLLRNSGLLPHRSR
jgi:hypothetical protein